MVVLVRLSLSKGQNFVTVRKNYSNKKKNGWLAEGSGLI